MRSRPDSAQLSLAIDVAATQCPDHCTWQNHAIHLGDVLGSGRFASVRAVGALSGLPPLAAKIVEAGHAASHEVALLAIFDHPHILRCFGLVQLSRYELILVERCAGELFERVQRMDSLDEHQAARWMLELVSAVEHTHAHGVVHRDIKPENILIALRTVDATSPLKLSDFGSAKRLAGVLHSPCGSHGYRAPETVTSLAAASLGCGEGYGTAADMWSCGVVAHVLLTGTLPMRAVYTACATEVWHSTTYATSALRRRRHPLPDPDPDPDPYQVREALKAEEALAAVSNEALDFLGALLRPHRSRLTASAALSHAWLVNHQFIHQYCASNGEPPDHQDQPGCASVGAPPPTRTQCTPSPPPPSPLLLTPKRLRETPLAAREGVRDAFREGASSGWSHADRSRMGAPVAQAGSHQAPKAISKGTEDGQRHERSQFASGYAPAGPSVAEIPQAELPPPAFVRARTGRPFASSARSLSAASGLDLLGHERCSRKRASPTCGCDAGLPLTPQTPSTAAACTPTSTLPSISRCAEPPSRATSVVTTPEPQLKRARSISSCLMDLEFHESQNETGVDEA